MNNDRDFAQLVSDLHDDEYDATEGGISMKFKAFEADLFEQSIQIKGLKHWCIALFR